MKKTFTKTIALVILMFTAIMFAGCSRSSYEFMNWNDCAALNSLKDYVSDVTNEKSENFIPVEDRIVVFDMDGTLYGELFPTYFEYLLLCYRCLSDENYVAPEDARNVAEKIMTAAQTGSVPDMAMEHAMAQAKVFAGMTIKEFEDYVTEFMKLTPAGFEGMTYGTAFYLPMLEVIDFLQKNDFKTYIVSGSDRYICRALAGKACNIPFEQIIGMDVQLQATEQGDLNGMNYEFKSTDKVVKTETVLIKNLKTNKVLQIAHEIDKQPVLSFGNSSGDVSMHLYTTTNNKYKSQAYMLIADDEIRDYGNTSKANALGENWRKKGFNVISMKNDWKTIYGSNVIKTK